MKLGDFVRVDMASEKQMIFVKEAENTMAPVLLERYGAAAADYAGGARGAHCGQQPPRLGASPIAESK